MLTSPTDTISSTQKQEPFYKLWFADIGSNLADGIQLGAAPLLAATLTRDPLLIAGLVFAQRLPWFLFTLISGALVDRLDRRKVLLRANFARAMLLAILTLLVMTNHINILFLYLIFFLIGIIETLFDNAALAILPSIVPQEHLERANGRLFATQTLSNEMLGPPLGSILFSAVRAAPFFLSSLIFAVSSTIITLIRGQYKPARPAQEQKLHAAILEGFVWFWRHRLLRTLGLVAGSVNFTSAAMMGIFVLYTQNVLGLDDIYYGFIIAAGAVGGIFGSLIAEPASRRFGAGRMLFLDMLGNTIALLMIALTTNPIIVACMFIIISMCNMLGNVILISLRQAIIPDHLLGRVASAYRLVVLGALPPGALFGGFIARQVGLTAPMWIGGLLLGFVTFAMLPIVNNRSLAEAKQKTS